MKPFGGFFVSLCARWRTDVPAVPIRSRHWRCLTGPGGNATHGDNSTPREKRVCTGEWISGPEKRGRCRSQDRSEETAQRREGEGETGRVPAKRPLTFLPCLPRPGHRSCSCQRADYSQLGMGGARALSEVPGAGDLLGGPGRPILPAAFQVPQASEATVTTKRRTRHRVCVCPRRGPAGSETHCILAPTKAPAAP